MLKLEHKKNKDGVQRQAAERFQGSLSPDKERGNGSDRDRDADRTEDDKC